MEKEEGKLNLVAILTAILNNILPALFKYLFTKKHYLVLFIALFTLVGGIFAVSSYFYDNSNFQKQAKFDKMDKAVVNQITPCQDGFMGTIGAVSITPKTDENNNEWHEGIFLAAFAIMNGEVIDLRDNTSLYREVSKVDTNTYNMFLKVGKENFFPEAIDFRNGIDLALGDFTTLSKFFKRTDWGKNDDIKTLYLTAITNKNPFGEWLKPLFGEQVIYVISFTSHKNFISKEGCNDIRKKLMDFNLEIQALDKETEKL